VGKVWVEGDAQHTPLEEIIGGQGDHRPVLQPAVHDDADVAGVFLGVEQPPIRGERQRDWKVSAGYDRNHMGARRQIFGL